MLYNVAISAWRTSMSYLVGLAAVLLVKIGIDPGFLDSAAVTAASTVVFGQFYYTVFRWLEERYSARWGWLLGLAEPPHYGGGADK